MNKKQITTLLIFITSFILIGQKSYQDVDSNWEIGSKWKIKTINYPMFKGPPIKGVGLGPGGEHLTWKQDWEKQKNIPESILYSNVEIIDTARFDGRNCWIFQFTCDTIPEESYHMSYNLYQTLNTRREYWISKETFEVCKSIVYILDDYGVPSLRNYNNNSYRLANGPGGRYWPSHIPLNIDEDSLVFFNDIEESVYGLNRVETNRKSYELGDTIKTTYFKNRQKLGKHDYGGPNVDFYSTAIIYWERNKNWWSSYKCYVDDELVMEAVYIEN